MIVFPSAKINLGLYVTDKRDDGYHNIETIFYPVGFSDILEVVPDRKARPGSIALILSGFEVEGSEEANLVVRAYRMLHEQIGLPGIQAYLHKCIPAGTGLGGGSSDGASMLLLLNKIFCLNLSYADLFGIALHLGSDCPYFLDPVPSFARGRGEELIKSDLTLRGYHFLLFQPGKGISTAYAYRNVTVATPRVSLAQIEKLPVASWKEVMYNAFEPYAFKIQPVIENIKDELYHSGAIYASMTGSGSAVYGLFDRDIEIPEKITDYFLWRERF